jgi:hypothetical protein
MDRSHRLHFPLKLEDYEALGALSAHYSYVEMLASIGVWSLLKLAMPQGTLITSKMALRQRLELMVELAPLRNIPTDAIETLKSILNEFAKHDGLTKRRNDLIHAIWSTDDMESPEKAFPISFPRGGGMKAGPHTTAEVIETVTKDVCTQGKRLSELMKAHSLFPTLLESQGRSKPSP